MESAPPDFLVGWLCPRIKTLLGVNELPPEMVDVLVRFGDKDENRGVRVCISHDTDEERFRWHLFTAHGMAVDASDRPWVLRRLTSQVPLGSDVQDRIQKAPAWDGGDARAALSALKAFGIYLPALFALAGPTEASLVDRNALRLEWRKASPLGAAPTIASLILPSYSPLIRGDHLCLRASWGRHEVYCRKHPDEHKNDDAVHEALGDAMEGRADAKAYIRTLRTVYQKAVELQKLPLLPRLRTVYADSPSVPRLQAHEKPRALLGPST